MLGINEIHNLDCMEGLPQIPGKSIDMVLSDLPYGILDCRWDKKIPLGGYFRECNRVIKDNGAIVLTATMKYAVELINANRMPMRRHELILVFYRRLPVYNPQGIVETVHRKCERRGYSGRGEYAYRGETLNKAYTQKYTGYPKSIMKFSNGNRQAAHPTQKPLGLFKYLILTYSNLGDVILDTCMGSGTTAVACVESGRQFVGFELDRGYCEVGRGRVAGVKQGLL